MDIKKNFIVNTKAALLFLLQEEIAIIIKCGEDSGVFYMAGSGGDNRWSETEFSVCSFSEEPVIKR